MTYNEIYVLNKALDGKDIYSIDTFENVSFPEIIINDIKDELIIKNILENYNKFTQDGIMKITLINNFKNAIKYIKIADLTIGCINNTKGILLQRENEEYKFSLINIENSLHQIMQSYPFLNSIHSKEAIKILEGVQFDRIIRDYELNHNNSFVLVTYKKKIKKITTDLFFHSKEQIYRYNGNEKKLYEISSQDVIEILHERLGV